MSFTLVRKEDGAYLGFDAILDETYSPTIATTDHPVEDGSSIVDHARVQPLSFTVTALVTESPYAPAEGAVTAGEQRVREALDFLRGCEGKLVDVATVRNGTIGGCLLTGYPHSFDAKRRLQFQLGFKQVRIANAVTFPVPAVATGAPANRDVGIQALKAQMAIDLANRKAEAEKVKKDKEQMANGGLESMLHTGVSG